MNSNLSWSDIATSDVLKPLNMSRSFFGPILAELREIISVPNTYNWANLVVGALVDGDLRLVGDVALIIATNHPFERIGRHRQA